MSTLQYLWGYGRNRFESDYWPLFWQKILGRNKITRSALGVSHRCKYISQLFYKNRIEIEYSEIRKQENWDCCATPLCPAQMHPRSLDLFLPGSPGNLQSVQCSQHMGLTNEHLTKLPYLTLGSFLSVWFSALFALLYSNHSQGNSFQDFSFPLGYSSLSDVNVIKFNSPFKEGKTYLLYKFLLLQIYQTTDSKKSNC